MARAEAAQAQLLADQAITARNTLLEKLGQRISLWSTRVSSGLFGAGVAVVVVAAILSIPGVFEGVSATTRWISRAILVAGAALGVYTQVQGPSLKDLRRGLQDRIAGWIRSRWLSADTLGGPTDDRNVTDEGKQKPQT